MTKRISPLFTWRSQLVEDPTLGASARHVALTLSLYMSERGDCAFPSVETLARDCARGKSTIVESLKSLELHGWLGVDRAPGAPGGRGRTNSYRATFPETVLLPTDSVNGPESETVLTDDETVLTPEETVLRAPVNGPESGRIPRQDHATTTPDHVAAPRRRDEIWDTFEVLYGPPEPSPHPDHGRRNRATKLARIAGAEVEELARLHTWASMHRDESIQRRVQTAIALATNIGDLRRLYATERGKNASDPVALREVEIDVDVTAHNAALEAADAARYGGSA